MEKKIIAGFVLIIAVAAHSAVITNDYTESPTDDARATSAGVFNQTSASTTAGDNVNNVLNYGVFVFSLPDLNSTNEIITGAAASFFLQGKNISADQASNPMPNIQLDIFFKDSSLVETSDHNAVAILSVSNFITSATVTGLYSYVESALAEEIAKVYNGTTSIWNSIVFRLQWQTNNTALAGNSLSDNYLFSTKENTAVSQRPAFVLTTTQIPEPATAGLFVISGAAAFLLRRNIRR